jgi:hypothetical protein
MHAQQPEWHGATRRNQQKALATVEHRPAVLFYPLHLVLCNKKNCWPPMNADKRR